MMKHLMTIFLVTTALSAFAFADNNYTYIQGPALVESFSQIATSAGTTTLTATSNTSIEFTGSTTQIVVLPNATTLQNGRRFNIYNRSTGAVTVKNNGGSTLATLQGGNQVSLLLMSNASSNGTWDTGALAVLSSGGTLPASSLPNPSSSTLGGVQSAAAVSHQWINSISTSGVPALSQPAFTDISGSVDASQMPALTGDVTTSAGAVATTVAKIAGTTVSGTTGSGNVCFSTSPTFTTSIVDPLLIGGTGVSSSSSIKSTSGIGTNDFINFLVGNNGGTEAMRIISSGKIGIGTASPGSNLSVNGAISAGSYSGTAAPSNSLIISGKVGVGTTNPSFVVDAQAATGTMSITSTTGTNAAYLQLSNTGNSGGNGPALIGVESSTGGSLITGTSAYATVIGPSNAYPIQLVNNNAVHMTILSGGNVGIGTTNPQQALDVNGGIAINGVLAISKTAPTISSGGCTSPTVPNANGTAAFTVNVGTGCSGSQPLVLTMPTAANGWACFGGHRTTATAGANVIQTSTSTTSVTLTNVTGGTTTAVAWTSSEVLQFSCQAY